MDTAVIVKNMTYLPASKAQLITAEMYILVVEDFENFAEKPLQKIVGGIQDRVHCVVTGYFAGFGVIARS